MAHYNEEETKIVKQYYPIVGAKHTVEALSQAGYKRSSSSVQHKAFKLGLKSGINNKRNSGCFQKGHVPQNKGKKMSKQIRARVQHTFFQAGHQPANTKYDGAITTRRDTKSGRQYKYIRLAKGKWVLYHRHLWKKHHGDIPRSHVVAFIDGDSLNCEIENLKLITRRENALRNYNREKFRETCKQMTDRQIAGRISFNDPELRKKLLAQPEIIEVARKRIHLNREIKKQQS